MKRNLFLLFLLVPLFSFGQQVKVKSIQQIDFNQKGEYYHPIFSPNSDYLLLTGANYAGVYQYQVNKKVLKRINSDPGAGYRINISDDGSTILYNKITLSQNKRYNSLVNQNVNTGNKKVIVKPTRVPITGGVVASRPMYVKGKKMVKAKGTNEKQIIVTIEDRKMVLYQNGNRKEILPNGKESSYIWPSISPDMKKIVYTVAGKGTFVCSLNGENVKSLGKLNAPKWAGNKFIVGMNDVDDGEKLISSAIEVVSIDGKVRQTISSPELIAMYPSANKEGDKIAFNTAKGEVYLLDVELK